MTVAFIGHRTIEQSETLRGRLAEIVTELIENGADTFLFGSKGNFNSLCYEIVSQIKEKYRHIRRVYVRAEYDYSEKFTEYFLTSYEETFFPDKVRRAGRLSYVIRNQIIVEMCDVLVTYCDMEYKPSTGTKSGTIQAALYAKQKKKQIINLF